MKDFHEAFANGEEKNRHQPLRYPRQTTSHVDPPELTEKVSPFSQLEFTEKGECLAGMALKAVNKKSGP